MMANSSLCVISSDPMTVGQAAGPWGLLAYTVSLGQLLSSSICLVVSVLLPLFIWPRRSLLMSADKLGYTSWHPNQLPRVQRLPRELLLNSFPKVVQNTLNIASETGRCNRARKKNYRKAGATKKPRLYEKGQMMWPCKGQGKSLREAKEKTGNQWQGNRSRK